MKVGPDGLWPKADGWHSSLALPIITFGIGMESARNTWTPSHICSFTNRVIGILSFFIHDSLGSYRPNFRVGVGPLYNQTQNASIIAAAAGWEESRPFL